LSVVLHAAGLYLLRANVPARGVELPPLPGKVTVVSAAQSVLLAARDPSWLQPGRYRDLLLPVPRVERPQRALQPALPPLEPVPAEVGSEMWVPALPPLAVQPRFEPRAAALPPVLAPVSARFESGGPEVSPDVLGRLKAAAPAPSCSLCLMQQVRRVMSGWCAVPAIPPSTPRRSGRCNFRASVPPKQGIAACCAWSGETRGGNHDAHESVLSTLALCGGLGRGSVAPLVSR
jgi:hypothetical protein